MPPLYKPPTKWPSVSVPWLSLVLKADPDFERRKHREIEYVTSGGRVFLADPYRRGAYNTPQRTVTVAYSGPQILNQGDITGVGGDFVTLISTSTTPGVFTTRSATQMFSDIVGATAGLGYALRIVNNANGGVLTFAPGAGVEMFDHSNQQTQFFTLRPNTYSDVRVQFPSAAEVDMMLDSEGSPYSALVG